MANESEQQDTAPKGLRFLVHVWGAITALCMVSTGLFVLLTISEKCVVAGIIQISLGVFVFSLEAPIFCTYFEMMVKVSGWVDSHLKYWMKGLLYLSGALPPFFLCLELSTFIGSGCLVVLASLYGVLSVGQKGNRDEKASTNAKDDDAREKLISMNEEAYELNTY